VATELAWADVAVVIAKAFLLPLAVGMVIRGLFPQFSERFSDRLLTIAGVVLTVAGVVLLVTQWRLFLAVRWEGMVTLAGLMLIALGIGHALGGPSPGDRTALAIACATRHIGIAVLVATAFRGPRTMVMIAAYIVVSVLVSLPYLQWRRRKARATERVDSAAG
jgi:BASS family bile acid:Na+ symporter